MSFSEWWHWESNGLLCLELQLQRQQERMILTFSR